MESKDILSAEAKKTNILGNIEYIMSTKNIPNPTALAKILELAPTTWYSFLKNPISNSNAKTAFCNHFGLTLYQLENEQLSESNSELTEFDIEKCLNDTPIITFSDDDVFMLLNSAKNAGSSNFNEIEVLKKAISDKMHLRYKSYMFKAYQEYQVGNYDTAYEYVSNAFFEIRPKDIEIISECDMRCFVELCVRKNSSSGIESFIDKFSADDIFNEKIILVFAALLEKDFSMYAQLCYELVFNKLSQ